MKSNLHYFAVAMEKKEGLTNFVEFINSAVIWAKRMEGIIDLLLAQF